MSITLVANPASGTNFNNAADEIQIDAQSGTIEQDPITGAVKIGFYNYAPVVRDLGHGVCEIELVEIA